MVHSLWKMPLGFNNPLPSSLASKLRVYIVSLAISAE